MRGGKGTESNWYAENDKLRTFEGASQRVEWITSGWCHGYMRFEWSCPGFLDLKLVLIDTFRENDNEDNGGMYCKCLLLECDWVRKPAYSAQDTALTLDEVVGENINDE